MATADTRATLRYHRPPDGATGLHEATAKAGVATLAGGGCAFAICPPPFRGVASVAAIFRALPRRGVVVVVVAAGVCVCVYATARVCVCVCQCVYTVAVVAVVVVGVEPFRRVKRPAPRVGAERRILVGQAALF